MITHSVRFLPPACTHNRQLEEKRGGWGRAGSQKSICVSFSLPLPPLKTPRASRGGRAEKIEVKNKKDINKEIRVFHIRSADWWRRQSGRSGPQLHSLFSELFYTVQPSDSNECWLWPLVSGYSGNCIRYKRVCVRLRASPGGDGRGVLDVRAVVRASRGAQSTVDGFYAIHTKLTDSVECSPRQAARQRWGKMTDGERRARAFRRRKGRGQTDWLTDRHVIAERWGHNRSWKAPVLPRSPPPHYSDELQTLSSSTPKLAVSRIWNTDEEEVVIRDVGRALLVSNQWGMCLSVSLIEILNFARLHKFSFSIVSTVELEPEPPATWIKSAAAEPFFGLSK